MRIFILLLDVDRVLSAAGAASPLPAHLARAQVHSEGNDLLPLCVPLFLLREAGEFRGVECRKVWPGRPPFDTFHDVGEGGWWGISYLPPGKLSPRGKSSHPLCTGRVPAGLSYWKVATPVCTGRVVTLNFPLPSLRGSCRPSMYSPSCHVGKLSLFLCTGRVVT